MVSKTIDLIHDPIPGQNIIEAIIRKSKDGAMKCDKLYHCAPAMALESIIKNKEFWLSNLADVNDNKEAERIDIPEYEKSYYVASFTRNNNVSEDNWCEYGKGDISVLFSVKKDWFKKSATFMTLNNQKIIGHDRIYSSFGSAHNERIDKFKKGDQAPLFYDFFAVIYDDELNTTMQTSGIWNNAHRGYPANYINSALSGIIKKTKGECKRSGKEPYEKIWKNEKEVRLKLCIKRMGKDNLFGVYYPKIAVPLNDLAFMDFDIRFNPKFPASERTEYINKLYTMLPRGSKITVLE